LVEGLNISISLEQLQNVPVVVADYFRASASEVVVYKLREGAIVKEILLESFCVRCSALVSEPFLLKLERK
jgi:hypothetical protein